MEIFQDEEKNSKGFLSFDSNFPYIYVYACISTPCLLNT